MRGRAVLLLLVLGACSARRSVYLSVAKIPEGAAALHLQVHRDGSEARERPVFDLRPFSGRSEFSFGFELPDRSGTTLSAYAGVFDGQGCLVATGHRDIALGVEEGILVIELGAPKARDVMCPGQPPIIVDVSPARTPTSGGKELTLSGFGFRPGSTATVSGLGAEIISLTPIEVKLRAPARPGKPGPAEVKLRGPDGLLAVFPRLITYVETVAFSTTDYPSDLLPDAILAVDLDRDGKKDLVMSGVRGVLDGLEVKVAGVINVRRNLGGGRFGDIVEYSQRGLHMHSVAAGDLDGDGDPDLVASDLMAGVVRVLLNQGDGTFPASDWPSYPAGELPDHIAIADFDGDGDLDLAVTNRPFAYSKNVDGTLRVLFNQGGGIFPMTVPPCEEIAGNPCYRGGLLLGFVAAADLNGDGLPDLATNALQADPRVSHPTYVQVFLNQGGGIFPRASTGYTPQASLGFIHVADLNKDSRPDIVVTGADSTLMGVLGVLINQGGGVFPMAPAAYAVSLPFTVGSGDFDEDGEIDLAVVNSPNRSEADLTGAISVFVNLGGGEFQIAEAPKFKIGQGASTLVVDDLNGDGRPDVAAISQGSLLRVMLNISK